MKNKPISLTRAAAYLMLLCAAPGLRAATILVTSTNDNDPGSLRAALAVATNGDTITFSNSLSGATILLTNGELGISNDLTIDASALAGGLQVNGNASSRIFNVYPGTTVTVDKLALINGHGIDGYGGAVLNQGTLTLNQVTLSGNHSSWKGGAIYNAGSLTLNQVTLSGNEASSQAGAIENYGPLVLNNCTFANNSAANGAGAIDNNSSLIANQCTFFGNSCAIGSAIWAGGNNSLVNCTLAGNSIGAAISQYNSAPIELTNTIVALNPNGNITGSFSGANNFIGGDPLLAPLGDYGGPTQTMPPLPGSPVIDAGDDSATNSFATDQRGLPRLSGFHVDIGAVESAPTAPSVVTQPASDQTLTTATLNATVTPNGAVTTYYFEYGTNTEYGATTASNTLSAGTAAVNASLTGLTPATIYHFRAVAANSAGTTFGNDLIFHTGGLTDVVINTNDSGAGSLRGVVANADSGSTIIFDSSLSGQTILLTSGQIVLNKSLTIDGSALPCGIQLNGNHASRIFTVNSGTTNVLNSLTITNGFANDGYGGGGINNFGTLTVNSCTLVGNLASSTLAGGGIFNSASLTVNQSTFTGNSADWGGAIFNNGGSASVSQCTLVGNAASNAGGGICNRFDLFNSIVASNTAPTGANIYGVVTYTGINFTDGNPMLAPLGNYGGPTPTMPPLPGSPAINAGSDTATNSFATDQRGLPRLSGFHVDIGAVESAPVAPTVVTEPATGQTLTTATLNATVTPNGAVTTYYFEYGTNTDYGATTASNTLSAGTAALNASLTGLTPATIYHFRAVAANSGGTTLGDDLIFHTGGLTDVVINTNDSGAGSLRDALAGAASGDTIDVTGVSGAIILTNGQLNVANSVTILGPGPGALTVSGNHASRVFYVTGTDVSIHGLTVADGVCSQNGGGINSAGNPGSVLTIDSCIVISNRTTRLGGGIYNSAGVTLTITNCTISGNRAPSGNAGGIYNSNATVAVIASTLSHNWASQVGGGIMNDGVAGSATLTIFASTLSSNSASTSGGGVCNYGGSSHATINASTFNGNSAGYAGGSIQNSANATVEIGDTILNAGTAGGNIYRNSGTVTSYGYNLSSDASGSGFLSATGDLNNTDPKLGPLQDNGGPTWTHALLPGSPAIDNGSDTITNSFASDQRGASFPRLFGLHVDIGAVESAYASTAPTVVTQPATGQTLTTATLHATVTPNGVVTTYVFEYGTNTDYGTTTASNTLSAGAAAVNASLTDLTPTTIYHFRAVAANSFGTTLGDDLIFRTGGLTNIVLNNLDDGSVSSLRSVVLNSISGDVITFTNNLSGQTILLTSGQIVLNKSLTIDGSALPGGIQLNGNHASRIFTVNGGTINVLNSLTITNGLSNGGHGGGINNFGTLTVNNCTFAGNAAGSTYDGGGIFNSASLTVNQSTFTGNSAYMGGAIYNNSVDNSASVSQCTLVGNTASYSGGGIYKGLNLFNSIVASNTAPNDANIFGAFTFTGLNLTNGNPMLAPLGNYGGPTPTMPPLPGSPAIDGCTNGTSFITDQRGAGFPRVVGACADIGAVEAQAGCNPLQLTGTARCGDGSFQFCFSNTPCASFTVFTTTNLALPFSNWTVLGVPVEIAPGQFQFTDPQATNSPQRYYRVTSP